MDRWTESYILELKKYLSLVWPLSFVTVKALIALFFSEVPERLNDWHKPTVFLHSQGLVVSCGLDHSLE